MIIIKKAMREKEKFRAQRITNAKIKFNKSPFICEGIKTCFPNKGGKKP
jgi:hypothetical protein